MFIRQTVTAILLIVMLFGNIVAQPNTPEISPELQKNAVDFLRQTIKEIPNLKADENRQFFMIESARLLWKYDEKEARVMFERMMQEVKQSLAKTTEKYKKAVDELKKTQKNSNANYGYYNAVNRPATNAYPSNRAYNVANSSVYIEPEISVYEVGMGEEFSKIASLRKNLIDSLTEVEPTLAYQFFTETNQLLPKNTDNYLFTDYGQFEKRIVVKLLEDKKIDKAVEITENVLNKGFNNNFLTILNEIYEIDKPKGSALAEKTLQKIKTLNVKDLELTLLTTFFDTTVENNNPTQPMLSDKSLRELARLLGNNVLAAMDRDFYSSPYDYAKKIKEYAPREALKILQKSKKKKYPNNSNSMSNAPYYSANMVANAARAAANTMANAANTMANAANTMANAANTMANAANTMANSAANSPKPKTSPTPQTSETPPINYNEFDVKYNLMQKLSIGKFTKDEREKIIKQAKEYAFSNNYWGYARPERFISVVMELAGFSIISADKEISDALMKEAEIYVRPETKNMLDYAGKLMLAGGYSKHQPDKSFALMESMASINEVIEGAFKLGVFIDVESSFIINDEVSAATFLGDLWLGRSVSRTEELQMFIQNLAKADFQRTKGLADKFARNEVKMTAKMLILDSLLGERRDSMREYDY